MPKLIFFAAAALALYIAVTRIKTMPAQNRKSAYLQLTFVVALIVAVLLAISGKMHWVGALLTGLLVLLRQSLPLIIQLLPHLKGWLGQSGAGTRSQVESTLLRMTLDHNNGRLDGTVLAGSFSGKQLSDLSQSDLDTLLDYCRANDADSTQLLLSYLEQRFGEAYQSEPPPASKGSSQLTEQEALAILGLDSGATKDDIVAAHRKLMQKLHPDRGGNDYLAARVNDAKAFLLGER
jgi:hypothetical protein